MALDVRAVGPRRWLIRAAIVSAVLLAVAETRAAGQLPATYETLVEQYASGDAATAIATLASWSSSAVAAASSGRARDLAAARQRAAVMLHTDTASVLMFERGGSAAAHLSAARRILSAMRTGRRVDDRARVFERRWFAVVAGLYTTQGKLDQAMNIVADGFGLYPHDARLYVARGAILEMNATLNAADPRNGNQLARVNRWLESAAADYLRAIGADGTLAVAHLHLGWVRFSANDDRCRQSFEAAVEHADDDRTGYLAHLFLGRLADRQNRQDDARREYEAALALGPAYQSAYVALSRFEEASGRSERAREIAHAFAGLAQKAEDPWWDYHLGGFDRAALEWLQHEARTP